MKNIEGKEVLVSSKVLTKKGVLDRDRINNIYIIEKDHGSMKYTLYQPETATAIVDFFNPFTDFYFLD